MIPDHSLNAVGFNSVQIGRQHHIRDARRFLVCKAMLPEDFRAVHPHPVDR